MPGFLTTLSRQRIYQVSIELMSGTPAHSISQQTTGDSNSYFVPYQTSPRVGAGKISSF